MIFIDLGGCDKLNILFLTMNNFETVKEHGIYTDLLRYMKHEGHQVTVVSPLEKKYGGQTKIIDEDGIKVIKVRTGNLFNVGLVTKLVSRFTIKFHYNDAIKKYMKSAKIDLVLYTTPPTTMAPVVQNVKREYGCRSYLMLKDIFPQNAVDLGMIKEGSLTHFILRRFEKKLYEVSDWIGCMSPANVEYLKKNNPQISDNRIGLCPNCFDYYDLRVTKEERNQIRKKYGIPIDKIVYIYGGNLGKPQGIPFLIECMPKLQELKDKFFLIVGQGTEYNAIKRYLSIENSQNIKLMSYLQKEDYGKVVASSDYGMILLDKRFTIPNFPSRLLDYMQAGIPIIACTDRNTDIGKIITEGKFGLWCESGNVGTFLDIVNQAAKTSFDQNNEIKYLKEHYTTQKCYEAIMSSITK